MQKLSVLSCPTDWAISVPYSCTMHACTTGCDSPGRALRARSDKEALALHRSLQYLACICRGLAWRILAPIAFIAGQTCHWLRPCPTLMHDHMAALESGFTCTSSHFPFDCSGTWSTWLLQRYWRFGSSRLCISCRASPCVILQCLILLHWQACMNVSKLLVLGILEVSIACEVPPGGGGVPAASHTETLAGSWYFETCYACPSLRWSLKLLQYFTRYTSCSFELGHM